MCKPLLICQNIELFLKLPGLNVKTAVENDDTGPVNFEDDEKVYN